MFMKKHYKLISVLIALCCVCVLFVLTRAVSFKRQTGFVDLPYEEWQNQDLSNHFLVISRDDCAHCGTFFDGMNSIIRDNRGLVIYYLDVNQMTDAQKEAIETKYDAQYVPTLLYISKEGKAIKFKESNNYGAMKENDYALLKKFINKHDQ